MLFAPRASYPEPRSYSVSIPGGLEPRMTPEEVATVVLNRLARPVAGVAPDEEGAVRLQPPLPKVLSMACTTGDKVSDYLPQLGKMHRDIVWVVRANGTFSKSTPGGGSIVRDYGHIVIDDSTGTIIAWGSSREDIPPDVDLEKTDSRYFWKVDPDKATR